MSLMAGLSLPPKADWVREVKTASCKKTALAEMSPDTQNPERYPKIMVLVSFSMPMTSLKALGAALKPLQGKLVFRGLYQNSFKEMYKKIQELGCEAVIDPLVFRTFHITQVPAFVVRSNTQTDVSEGHVIAGHMTLRGALEIMASKNVLEAKNLLEFLEKGTL